MSGRPYYLDGRQSSNRPFLSPRRVPPLAGVLEVRCDVDHAERRRRLALRLVAIHPPIRARQQALVRLAIIGIHGGAGAHVQRHELPREGLEPDRAHRVLQATALLFGLRAPVRREQDDELVAAVAHADVVGTCRLAQRVGDFLQRTIAARGGRARR